MSAESCQTMSAQLQTLNILTQAQSDETGPCMRPNVDLRDQQAERG